MSLLGALNIGRSALSVEQAALQVTGNNISNAGNADYSRETITQTPGAYQQIDPGIFVGSGVNLTGIRRQVSESLNARIRNSHSDNQAATTSQNYLSQVESSFNALGTTNISTQMGAFFTSWSSLANTPQDAGLRQVVLQKGQAVSVAMTNERTQLTNVQDHIQQQIATDVKSANTYLKQIANFNVQIVAAQGGSGGSANGLADQRDATLKQLAGLMDIQTVDSGDGALNVYVGSQPMVVAGQAATVTLKQQLVDGSLQSKVATITGGPLGASSGEINALLDMQSHVADVTTQVDGLAHNLISTVNAIHSSGQGTEGITSVTASNAVADPTVALNAPATGLKFTPTNGSFVLHVGGPNGPTTSTLVKVTLNGGATDTSLNSLATSLNAISGVTATIANGKLTIASSVPGNQITFSQDSSGTLASLGINTFFSGSDARNIGVNAALVDKPTLIAAAKNGDTGDNQTALAIAALNTQKLSSLGNASLQDNYQAIIDNVAGHVSLANTNLEAAGAVLSTLNTQHDALSGVSLDEESVNMITQQRAYQGAAIFITTVNNMMTTLLGIIR